MKEEKMHFPKTLQEVYERESGGRIVMWFEKILTIACVITLAFALYKTVEKMVELTFSR